jgi:uncharacterized damage-inducible protein DinB
MSNTECLRISEQIRRAFEGKAWHGPSLAEALEGVTPQQASAHPVEAGHSIWELALHIEGWTRIASAAIDGKPMPEWPMPEASAFLDWPPAPQPAQEAWQKTVANVVAAGKELAARVSKFQDLHLQRIVPGRKYDFYFLFHGIAQHAIYHGGQITLLKRALSPVV